MEQVRRECLSLKQKFDCKTFLDIAIAYAQMSTVIESTAGHTDRFHSGNEKSMFEVKVVLSTGYQSTDHCIPTSLGVIPGCLYYPEYGVGTYVRIDKDMEIHCLHDVVHCTKGIKTTLNSQYVNLRGGIRGIQTTEGKKRTIAVVQETTVVLTFQR